ncbi:MAG: hypothetical protein OHK0031_07610 [Anaerolineales bacterium]
MAQKGEYHSAPPFVEPDTQKTHRHDQGRSQLSQFSMVLGLAGLTMAFLGSGKLIWDVLQGAEIGGLPEKIVLLTVTFLFGWVACLVSIRSLENLVLPYILRGYSLLVVASILLIYARVIFKIFDGSYDPAKHLLRYSGLLVVGFVVLIALGLLLEHYDMRPLSYPLLAGAAFHLFTIVVYYFFMFGSKPEAIRGHIFFFLFILMIAILMLVHLGILNPARQLIDILFARDKKSLHLEQ